MVGGLRMVPMAYRGFAVAAALALALGGCQTTQKLLPSQTEADNGRFDTYTDVQHAYDRIQPGRTSTHDLAGMGFDVDATSNVEVLSYLGVIERFMPRESIHMDDLDPTVRQCLQSRVECTAYIFRPQFAEKRRIGNLPLDLLGFKRTTQQNGWSAEVLLVIKDSKVIYKLWAGKPHMDGVRTQLSPLGPFQDLSGVAGGAVANVIVP